MKVKLQLTYEVDIESAETIQEYCKDVMETAEIVFEEGTLTMQVDDGIPVVLDSADED